MERDLGWPLDALVADTRASVTLVAQNFAALRHDVRRLDDRLFQLMLVTLATLATTIASVVANLLS